MNTTPPPDYYAILGLPVGASPEEIKKRYRELARRYHPDVNSSPEASQKIKIMNEAHRVLGDPDRRSTYDAERALRGPVPPPPRASTASAPSTPNRAAQARPAPGRPFGARPASGGAKVEYDGFGTVRPENDPPAAHPSPPKPSAAEQAAAARKAAAAKAAEQEKIVAEAQIAFLTRNYDDAMQLCRQALSLSRSNATAHEILGDIYAIRGQTDEAVKAYSYAIQFNPRSYGAQGKLDRLIGRRPSSVPGPTMSRSVVRPNLQGASLSISREVTMMVISVLLFAGFCGALALFALNPGPAIGGGIPWITSLSFNMILTLACEGVIGGVLLAFYGKLRPVSEELVAPDRIGGPPRRPIPLLLILTLFSLVWFYASLLVYIVLTATRSRFSGSTVRVYGLVVALIVLFTFMAVFNDRGVGGPETAAFAGNVLFPGVLLGWFLGDCVRLRGQ